MTTYRTSLATVVAISCFWFISACQTTTKPTSKTNAEILDTQKSMIMSYLDAAEAKRAHAELRPLIMKHPKDADLQNLMGLTQLALDNKARAVTHFRNAYKLNGSPASGLNLSSSLIDTGKYKEAEKILGEVKKRGLEAYPYPERLEHNLGYAAEMRKNLKQAEKHYVTALEENPGFYLSLIRLAGIYERTNRQSQAMTKYEMARVSCKVCFDPIKALFRIHLQENRRAQATALLKEFIKTDKISALDKKQAEQTLNKLDGGNRQDILDQKVR